MKHSIIIYLIVFVLVCDVALSKRPGREDEKNMRKEEKNRRKEERNMRKEGKRRRKQERNNCDGRVDEFMEIFKSKYEEDLLPDCFDQVEEFKNRYSFEDLSSEEIKETKDEIHNEWKNMDRKEKKLMLNCLKRVKSNIYKEMKHKPSGRCKRLFRSLINGNNKYPPLLILSIDYDIRDGQASRESKPSSDEEESRDGENSSEEDGTSDETTDDQPEETFDPNEEDAIPTRTPDETSDDQPEESFDPNEEAGIPTGTPDETSDDRPKESFDPNEEAGIPTATPGETADDQPEESFGEGTDFYNLNTDDDRGVTDADEYNTEETLDYNDYETEAYTEYQIDYDSTARPNDTEDYYYYATEEPNEEYGLPSEETSDQDYLSNVTSEYYYSNGTFDDDYASNLTDYHDGEEKIDYSYDVTEVAE